MIETINRALRMLLASRLPISDATSRPLYLVSEQERRSLLAIAGGSTLEFARRPLVNDVPKSVHAATATTLLQSFQQCKNLTVFSTVFCNC